MSPTTTTATSSPSALTAGTWEIDPVHSDVSFTVIHLGLARVRGRFNTFSGTLTIDENQLASTVTASIELASVDTNNEMRDGHLRGADFFDTESNPTMHFASTAVTDNTLNGDLTIRGLTRPVSLDLDYRGVALDNNGATRAGFRATGQISRSDFGMEFNAPLGIDGMLIGDKIQIELEIEAIRQ